MDRQLICWFAGWRVHDKNAWMLRSLPDCWLLDGRVGSCCQNRTQRFSDSRKHRRWADSGFAGLPDGEYTVKAPGCCVVCWTDIFWRVSAGSCCQNRTQRFSDSRKYRRWADSGFAGSPDGEYTKKTLGCCVVCRTDVFLMEGQEAVVRTARNPITLIQLPCRRLVV